MKRLSLIDDSFLRLESRRTPLHIGSLILFEPPEDADENFASELFERLSQDLTTAEPFNRLLVKKNGLHYWEDDKDFDLENHFVHTVLPKPGRIRELLALVSRLHCSHLDRMYPLWRIHLIEGLEDGRFAMYIKVHHSLVDGMSAMRSMLKAMSFDPEESKKLPAIWAVPTKKSSNVATPVPRAALGGLSAFRSLAKDGAKSLLSPVPLVRELAATYMDYFSNKEDVMIGLSPTCTLTQPISSTRRFAAQSYSRPRIKAVASAFGGTSNDVILAMCGGALRRYLLELDDLPDRPIMAGVPVSVRAEDSQDYNNEVAFSAVHLATHIEDPAERMQAIKRCMDKNKKHMQALQPNPIAAYSSLMLMPALANKLLNFAPDCGLGGVVISHVPGPQHDLYMQGAKVSGLYPMSLLLDGCGLNFTIISRRDDVDIGIIACRKTVPRVQRMLDFLEEALVELECAIPGGDEQRKEELGKEEKAKKIVRKMAARSHKQVAKAKAS